MAIEEANGKKGSTSPLVLFPNLKSLLFWCMKEWEEWDGMGERREEEGESGDSVLISIMPCLQILDIWECPKLKSLPNFLEKTSLEELGVDCGISNWMTLATLSGLKTPLSPVYRRRAFAPFREAAVPQIIMDMDCR